MKVRVALTNTNLYRNAIIEHLDLSNNRLYFTSSINLFSEDLKDNVIMVEGAGEHCNYIHCHNIRYINKEDDKYIFEIIKKEEKKKK